MAKSLEELNTMLSDLSGRATSLEEQITVGGEKSSSGDHEAEDEALAVLPPGGLTTPRGDVALAARQWRRLSPLG
ncbi:hypothetical protein MSG28_011619 [Choristoneura fumiferana]|uniref:Uncharacterized protein n=1 Tax=Choristoneura fumiferana TaxID=7141 RepID=A0ACC0JNZ4_CHOFU|nr:hypothetical protein MSG28_011619 [Choristoneura fumiferana]